MVFTKATPFFKINYSNIISTDDISKNVSLKLFKININYSRTSSIVFTIVCVIGVHSTFLKSATTEIGI